VASFSRLAKHFESFYDLLAAVDKVGQLFDLPLERSAVGAAAVHGGDERGGRIVCTDVSLSHAGQTLLQDFSFELGSGDRVGLMADSVVRRSALLDVIAGTRAPSKGYVTLDDRDLRDSSPATARDRISLIRFPQILPATILENLTLGRLDVHLEELQSALSAVGLLDEVRRLPDGLETRIDERGGALGFSGAIRLEIARVLIARPSVILLDLQVAGSEESWMQPALDALFDAEAPWSLLAVTTSAAISNRCHRFVHLDSTSGDDSKKATIAEEGAPANG
jgi:ABC-type multidrug transport system fused ATPase/permease subunit